jgi:chromosome segregation ATPase
VFVSKQYSVRLSFHRTCLQTDLEAQLHSARTRLARESAARRDEVDLLNGRIIAHQQSLEASERSLGETLDERSKLMRLLSESETRCQALAAQVDQLRKSLAEAGDLEVN